MTLLARNRLRGAAARTARRARIGMRRIRRDNRAIAMVEFALLMPFLVSAGMGGIEIGNMALVHTRMSQIALSSADNVSRIATGSALGLPQVRETDINDAFAGAELSSGSMRLGRYGRIIVSSLQRNADGGQTIAWQRCYGDRDAYSNYGVEGTGATGTAFPGMGPEDQEVTAPVGSAVIYVELEYEYQPLVFSRIPWNRVVRTEAAYNIREARDLSQVYNPSPAATVNRCPPRP